MKRFGNGAAYNQEAFTQNLGKTAKNPSPSVTTASI
jgi:hypothetical protein